MPDKAETNDLAYWRARPSLARPGPSALGGRGLFALAPIEPGALIERACTVEIKRSQVEALDAMVPLGDFYFAHPKDETRGLMAFGLMSLLNHSEAPNAHIVWKQNKSLGWLADLVALSPIAKGAEITYRYKCVWFKPASP